MTTDKSTGVPDSEIEPKWFVKGASYKLIQTFEDPVWKGSDLRLGEIFIFSRADYGRYDGATRYTFKYADQSTDSEQHKLASFVIDDSTPLPKWENYFQRID